MGATPSQRREQLEAAQEQLGRQAASRQQSEFFELLRPKMKAVLRQARRELRIMQLDGDLPPGQWTAADLVDDVLLIAYEQFDRRPPSMNLDTWLIHLLGQRLAEIAQGPREVPLEEAAASGASAGEEAAWWDEVLGEGAEEELSWEAFLPGQDQSEQWSRLQREQQKRLIVQLLRDLPKQQRHAFMIYSLEGFQLEDIALIQNRSAELVQRDIELARRTLQQRLMAQPETGTVVDETEE